jgi:hypothetical protein
MGSTGSGRDDSHADHSVKLFVVPELLPVPPAMKTDRFMNHPRHQLDRTVWAHFICGLAIAISMAMVTRAGEEPTPEQEKFFESRIRPLLAEHCFKCHGEQKQKGGLRLDSRGHLLAGGESGPAIEPGKPDDSLLIEAIRYESFEMPPSGPLEEKDVEALVAWVKMGAPWPGDSGEIVHRSQTDPFSADDRAWWSFQPVTDPQPPEVRDADWCRNDVDRFVAAKLAEANLTPAPEAERRTLIRRLYFDLVGLPPTPDDVDRFIEDQDPLAYEHLVENLLASPQYGERWGRHWLDLVRYADSDGYRADHFRPDAWRYRDYVIQSLNDDKPYDRFIQEQLAGDELFPDDPDALVATGYLRQGIYEYNIRDVRGQWDVILNEITDVTADVFLGLGLQCARCHDHKFDPLLQKDYFRLRAFFEPIVWRDDIIAALPQDIAEHDSRQARYDSQTATIQKQLAALEQPYRDRGEKVAVGRFPDDIQAMIHKSPEERTPQEEQLVQLAWRQVLYEHSRLDDKLKGEAKEKILALRRQLAAYEKDRPEPLPQPMTITDVGKIAPATVIPKKRTEVLPGFPTILSPEPATIKPIPNVPNTTGRRTALAKWLTDPQNPLSTRVIVNRVWQYHFGRGLAENSSDFGRLGAPPTHPQLLDWLTSRFIENGWHLKDLHRWIVTSATYRQSTQHPRFADYQQKDPANRWYWRCCTRRLDAEQIRDSIFAVTGQLDPSRGGPPVLPDKPRRSIYARYMRNSRDPLLDVFDLPQFFSSTASRDTTTSPVQSLLLINSQTMLRHAAELARRVREAEPSDPEAQVRQLWRLVYGREATAGEVAGSIRFLHEQAERISGKVEPEFVSELVTGKLPYRDGQSVLFQPAADQGRFAVSHGPQMDVDDFTIEAFFQLRSVYDSGSVRTLAAKWAGGNSRPGWGFGVTGKGSRRKPQTLVLQIIGRTASGKLAEAALFSDQNVEINKPYFAAAAVHLADEHGPGSVKFYLKDLSNDDEPLLMAEIKHDIVGGFQNQEPLTLGTRGMKDGRFDGLIDDIRFSRGQLSAGQLLFTNEGQTAATIGYWQLEPTPGVFRDTSSNALNIHPLKQDQQQTDPQRAALGDLCHALLNTNEFLYID